MFPAGGSSSLPPSPPRLSLAVQSSPPPPLPNKDEESVPFPAPPPRSPGALKSLRVGKPWNKEIKALNLSKSLSSDGPVEDGGKSPTFNAFTKSTFSKINGLFQKKSGSDCK